MDRHCGSNRHRPSTGLWGLWLAAVWILAAAPLSAPAAEPAGDRSTDRVYITSDRLSVDMAGRTAEFTGNVRAEQGTTIINAQRLKVTYTSRADTAPAADAVSGPAQEGAIERLEASDQVVIHFDDRVAEADHAVYTTADRILVLTGQTARITSGPNTVQGGRIILHRADDRITVEKSVGGQVKAVFFTENKGLR